VEVGHVKQFRLTVIEPLSACKSLTLRTAFVTARVVPDALMATIAALLDVTPESGGSRGCGPLIELPYATFA
jgi:hypothetical protein